MDLAESSATSQIMRAQFQIAAATLLALMGLVYLSMKSAFYPQPAVDFPYLWLAGDLWSHGINPYSHAFEAAGKVLITRGDPPDVWFYPPNWWPFASLLASMPFHQSMVFWRIFGALSLIAGTVTLAWSHGKTTGWFSYTRAALAVAFACIMSATPSALAMGQTSLLIYAGLALYVAALQTGSRPMMLAALVLVMLKPQVGLPLAAFLLANARWWLPLGAAALLSIIAAMPALVLAGPMDFLHSYIAQLSVHEQLDPNRPLEMTGLRYLAYELFGLVMSNMVLMTLSAVAAAVLGWSRRSSTKAEPLTLACLLGVIILAAPLHSYDMMLIIPMVFLSSTFGAPSQALCGVGLLLLFRPNNLAVATGFYNPQSVTFIDSRMATMGILVVGLGILAELYRSRRKTAPGDVQPISGERS